MKALPPTPRRTAIRTPASLLSCSQAADRPSYIRQVMALRACGRSNRIVATAPSRTKRTSPSIIGLTLHFCLASLSLRCHHVTVQEPPINVRYWHLADNPAAAAFVRYWTAADIGPGRLDCNCL